MAKYKKYILFQFESYYPCGGLYDLRGSFDTIEEAKQHTKKNLFDYNVIVDRDTWEEVWDSNWRNIGITHSHQD